MRPPKALERPPCRRDRIFSLRTTRPGKVARGRRRRRGSARRAEPGLHLRTTRPGCTGGRRRRRGAPAVPNRIFTSNDAPGKVTEAAGEGRIHQRQLRLQFLLPERAEPLLVRSDLVEVDVVYAGVDHLLDVLQDRAGVQARTEPQLGDHLRGDVLRRLLEQRRRRQVLAELAGHARVGPDAMGRLDRLLRDRRPAEIRLRPDSGRCRPCARNRSIGRSLSGPVTHSPSPISRRELGRRRAEGGHDDRDRLSGGS